MRDMRGMVADADMAGKAEPTMVELTA